MDPVVIALIVIAILFVGTVIMLMARKREGQRLEQRFGPEFEREVKEAQGSRAKAQATLLERERKVAKLDIRPLQPAEREAYLEQWTQVQARFVDDPERSIAFADALVADVMKARGYPVEDFEQRAADISVENPEVVQNYRAAHAIATRHREGRADNEDLRHALLGYRALFDELLGADATEMAH